MASGRGREVGERKGRQGVGVWGRNNDGDPITGLKRQVRGHHHDG